MENARQYVEIRFKPEDQRGYSYHNDGEPVAVGDKVRVDARGSEKIVEVVHLSDEAPPFETKPIIGKVEEPADQPESEA